MASPKQKRDAFPVPFVVSPKQEHKQTFVLLHGLGSSGEQFGSEMLQMHISKPEQSLLDIFPHARFIFPSAKLRRSTAFNRSMIAQWFDIARLGDSEYKKKTQVEGLVESAAFLYNLLVQEAALVGTENLVFGGISHGCAMSAVILVGIDFPFGAYVGLCGWLPFRRDLQESLDVGSDPADDVFEADENESKIMRAAEFSRDLLELHERFKDVERTSIVTPVFIAHGQNDEKVLPRRGSDLAETLDTVGYSTTFRLYPGLGHGFNEQELRDVADFVTKECSW